MVVVVCESDNWNFTPKKKWIRHYLGKGLLKICLFFYNIGKKRTLIILHIEH